MTAQPKRSSSAASSMHASEPTGDMHEQIRRRAYELYEQRGRADGYDLDDWLQSESEVMTQHRRVAA